MQKHVIWVLWTIIAFCFFMSSIAPYERSTWMMEVAPIVFVVPVLWFTRHRFPLTSLLMILIALHALVLIVGGAYTYARVPLGFWMQDVLDLQRNPYDKIGHFMQGLVPSLAARELMIRRRWVNKTSIAGVFSVCVAMTVSAIYELIEWWAALALGQGADAFLGTQGDMWDTQSDMFFALLGSLFTVILLKYVHDKQLRRVR